MWTINFIGADILAREGTRNSFSQIASPDVRVGMNVRVLYMRVDVQWRHESEGNNKFVIHETILQEALALATVNLVLMILVLTKRIRYIQ